MIAVIAVRLLLLLLRASVGSAAWRPGAHASESLSRALSLCCWLATGHCLHCRGSLNPASYTSLLAAAGGIHSHGMIPCRHLTCSVAVAFAVVQGFPEDVTRMVKEILLE